jgi:hypothetical protein
VLNMHWHCVRRSSLPRSRGADGASAKVSQCQCKAEQLRADDLWGVECCIDVTATLVSTSPTSRGAGAASIGVLAVALDRGESPRRDRAA